MRWVASIVSQTLSNFIQKYESPRIQGFGKMAENALASAFVYP